MKRLRIEGVSNKSNAATTVLNISGILDTSVHRRASSISVFFGTLLLKNEKYNMGVDYSWMDSTGVSIAFGYPDRPLFNYIHLRRRAPNS